MPTAVNGMLLPRFFLFLTRIVTPHVKINIRTPIATDITINSVCIFVFFLSELMLDSVERKNKIMSRYSAHDPFSRNVCIRNT